jgi:hypothetical protein
MLEPVTGMVGNPICTCCGAAALFQDLDSHALFYCPVCAAFSAETTADVALKALLAIFKARSPYLN